MRYHLSSQVATQQPLSRPKGRATPFFHLRALQRYKAAGRFRSLQLFSVKNLTLILIVLAFMLMWSKQVGYAPSLDMAATQIFTPTTQHVLNFSDALFSSAQETLKSNTAIKIGQVDEHDVKDDIMAPPVREQTEASTSSSSNISNPKDESGSLAKKLVDDNSSVNSVSWQGDQDNAKPGEGSKSQRTESKDVHRPYAAQQESEDEYGLHQELEEANDASAIGKSESSEAATALTEELREPVKTPKPLAEVLQFTPATAINFMHFHKTGGVSFKTSLHKFYFDKFKGNGEKVRVQDACYSRTGVQKDTSKPSFLVWRCDWDPIREKNEEERNKIDFTFGHQFWGNGVGDLLNQRDVRSFTIMRHPFDRKVSFYFHFFVREVGRKEEDVTYEEIRDFLLYDKLAIKADLGRDLGPNYMAGRLLSDGIKGYVGNNSFRFFEVEQDRKYEVAEEALKLLRGYLFVGLQAESGAAKCMLKKVVELFNQVNGVDNSGLELIDDGAKKLNSGSYSLDAKRIWSKFSAEEKIIFDRKERVDLLIYEEGERLFQEHAQMFGCAHRVAGMKYKP